jgi:proline dehydrogenase
MDEIRENFLKQAFRLLKEGNLPAIATHDEILIEQISAFIEAENISRDSFYFELLYGVRRDIQKALLRKGYQVRIYVPYGKAWLPYTLRRLAERKENIIFIVKNLFRETLGLGKFSKS